MKAINVDFLSKEAIERDAQALLAGYFKEQGHGIEIPIPVEEILEIHLGLSLDFDDLPALLGIPDVLGALYVEKGEVFIDQTLDPSENPQMEGRFNFSVAHETGHWRLHRHYLASATAQAAMFTDQSTEPSVICRTTDSKERVEWQADYFASCLLMPRQAVLEAWSDRFGSLTPVVFAEIASQNRTRRPTYKGLRCIDEIMRTYIKDTFAPHTYAFETVAKEFNSRFRVSVQAMQIRLESLGLLKIGHPGEQDLFSEA